MDDPYGFKFLILDINVSVLEKHLEMEIDSHPSATVVQERYGPRAKSTT